jgi:hypothetical protein
MARVTLLIPFESSAFVTAFSDEIFRGIARQSHAGLAGVTPATHVATLHLDGENGAVIDCEDVLGDVVVDPKLEKLFVVLSKKAVNATQPPEPAAPSATITASGDEISIRLATAANTTPVVFNIPKASTIRQLHTRVAQELGVQASLGDTDDTNECNCGLSRRIAASTFPRTDSHTLLIHGKSAVQPLQLSSPGTGEEGIKTDVREHLGQYVEAKKKLTFTGGLNDPSNHSPYTKLPVVAVCSKHHHTPEHACSDAEATSGHILDLHTAEILIAPGCFGTTLEASGPLETAVDNGIDIYAVTRATSSGQWIARPGRDKVFRSQPHWEPPVLQSERGTAMFLSALRVFAHVFEQEDARYQDAVLHVFDLLVKFPPAVRALHVLINGKTPTPPECASLSHAIYQALDGMIPTALIGTNHRRTFEGFRLLFGFLLEKARSLKLGDDVGEAQLPYLSGLKELDLRDRMTLEAITHPVQTANGLMERALYDALGIDGSLHESPLGPQSMVAEMDVNTHRVANLSAGRTAELLAFDVRSLAANYRYNDSGNAASAWDENELTEKHHLAEFCGRNRLNVYKPRELVPAQAPCLTLDRKAHLAVYTGEEACGAPGHSSLVFRPMHGTETMDAAIIEQLIAPIIKQYEAEGTAVFDTLGSAAVRRLQVCFSPSLQRQANKIDEMSLSWLFGRGFA